MVRSACHRVGGAWWCNPRRAGRWRHHRGGSGDRRCGDRGRRVAGWRWPSIANAAAPRAYPAHPACGTADPAYSGDAGAGYAARWFGSPDCPLTAHHQADATETAPQDPQAVVAAALLRLEALFPGVDLHADQVALAYRPVPGDGLPVLGAAHPGLWVAVMRSGVTLAPLAAECLAAEVLGQSVDPVLGPYQPGRFRT